MRNHSFFVFTIFYYCYYFLRVKFYEWCYNIFDSIGIYEKNYKTILILVFTLLFVPNVYASQIKEVKCVSKTDVGAEVEKQISINDNKVEIEDTIFKKTGDYLKCKITINNNTEDDLVVDIPNISNKSNEFIEYKLLYDDLNLIKKNKTKNYSLEIIYKKEYSEAKTLDNNIVISMNGGKR